jgi:hypothetical protein
MSTPATPSTPSTPVISYVLATDELATVRGVLAALDRQTIAAEVELVLISPTALAGGELPAALGAVRTVTCPAPLELHVARALGVHAAAAPLVFIGETHSFPEPEMLERIVAAFAGPWSAVVPAIVNANPQSAASWAGFLFDYGAWHPRRAAVEVPEPLVYNSSFRRAALLETGERLAAGLSAVDHDLWRELATRGHRAFFEPAARIAHLNVARAVPFLRERWLCGARFGRHRARRWEWPRRLLYAAATPLVPLVLAARARGAMRDARRHRDLPAGFRRAAAAGLAARAIGEAAGYLGLAGARVESRATEYEVHKTRYAGSRA